MNIARWLIAYGICAVMGGATLASLRQIIGVGCDGVEACAGGFSMEFALQNFDYFSALQGTLMMTPIMALFGFVPALIIFGLPEALGIRPSGLRNAMIAAVFVGAPFLYLYWDMAGGNVGGLLTGDLFVPITAASMLAAMTLGLLRQGPLCYRKPE